jgi:nucleotide-binding universal stress UspA family protein
MERCGGNTRIRGGLEAQPLALESTDSPWRPIVQLAEKQDARAVVVGSHGQSLF